MSGPIALITGASRGIGRACSRRLASAGFSLRMVSRSKRLLAEAVRDIARRDHRCLAADLTRDVGREKLMTWLGSETPNVVVHCIGGRASDPGGDPWKTAMLLNFHAVVSIDDVLVPRMRERGHGTIVYLSSSAAAHGRASTPYACAKAALNRYISSRGGECVSHGVTLVGLMPAAVEGDDNEWSRTAITDPTRYARMCQGQLLGRPQTTAEVAEVVAFLCTSSGRLFGACILPADPAISTS